MVGPRKGAYLLYEEGTKHIKDQIIGQLRSYVLVRTSERKKLLRKEIQENIRIEQDENETFQNRKSAVSENEITRKIAALHEEISGKCSYSLKYDLGRSLMRCSGTRQNILTTDEKKQDEYFIAFFANTCSYFVYGFWVDVVCD